MIVNLVSVRGSSPGLAPALPVAGEVLYTQLEGVGLGGRGSLSERGRRRHGYWPSTGSPCWGRDRSENWRRS